MQASPAPDTGHARRSLRELPGLALALVLACIALWPVLAGGFVYDDLVLVLQNPTIRSWGGLSSAWNAAYWDFLAADTAQRLGYWRPLTAVALFAGRALGGGAPWGFHCVSLALHLCATSAAFFLARRLSRSVAIAALSAALFAVHPVQVEALAWISSVNDPLYGLFVLLGLNTYLAWRERGSRGLPLAASLCFALALLAKENAVAFLPLVAALELGRRERGPRTAPQRAALLRPWSALLAVAVLYYLVRVAVFGELGAGIGRVTNELGLPPSRLLSLRFELLGGFLGLLVWPGELSLFREIHPVIELLDGGRLVALAAIAVWSVVTLLALRRDARPLAFALLVPVAGVLPALVRLESLGRFVLSDRFLYVSAFGAALAFALLVLEHLPRLPGRALALLVVLAAAWHSNARTHDWRDEESLFRATVAASPESVYARWGLGRVLLDRFQQVGDPALVEEALAEFEAVQDLVKPRDGSPPSPRLYFTLDDICQANVGVGYCFLYRALVDPQEYGLDEALLVFDATLERFPDSPEALTGRAVTRMHLHDDDGARADLARALELDGRFVSARFNLGQLELRRGDFAAAARNFEQALDLQPDDSQTALWLGTALVEGGLDPLRARELLEQARASRPEDPAVVLQLGALEANAGNWPAALGCFDAALRLEPSLGRAHLLRAKVLLRQGEVERALGALGEACRLMPDDLEAHLVTGNALAERGFAKNARPYLQRALELAPQGPYAQDLRAALAAIDAALASQAEDQD